MLINFKNIRANKNNFLKLICLTTLTLGSTIQAMDPVYVYPGNPVRQTTPGTVVGKEYQEKFNEQLLDAAQVDSADDIEQLLRKGADINAYGKSAEHFGRTALMEAVGQHRYDICKLLIEKGADVNAQSRDGRRLTALMIAASQLRKEICKLLIDHGANVYAFKIGRETALVCAANSPYLIPEESKRVLDVCEFLIDAMIKKPTKEQQDSLVALMGISKKKRSDELDLVGPHVVRLIGQEAKREIDLPNAITKAQIMKIQNPSLKRLLLHYFNQRIKE